MKNARTVLITGASSGIGAAIAERLARDGYRVFGTTRNLSNLGEVSGQEIPPASAEAASTSNLAKPSFPFHFLELDVTKPDSVRKCVEEVIKIAGRIDVLINNAGCCAYGSVEELPVETTQVMFDTDVFGPIRMIQAVVPAMRQRRDGLIICISSLAGRLVFPFGSQYAGAKAALESITIGLRQELRPFNIGVTILEPSDIKTRLLHQTIFFILENSPYQPWRDRVFQFTYETMATAPPPTVVAGKVASILRKKRPGPIYTCGILYQRIAPFVYRLVPKRVEMKLTRIFYGLGFK